MKLHEMRRSPSAINTAYVLKPPAVAGKASVRGTLDQLPRRGNGARRSRPSNFAMALGRNMITSISKATDTEGSSLTTEVHKPYSLSHAA